MPTKSKTRPLAADIPDAFSELVVEALRHVHDPAWLGEHSPLAAPYFLGERLRYRSDANTATRQGEALAQLLRQSNDLLAGENDEARAHSRLIKQRYFDNRSPEALADERHIARATLFRALDKATQQLAKVFVRQIRPSLRPEVPARPLQLVGRQEILAVCQMALQQGRSVGLSGPAGIGKTTLGSELAARLRDTHGQPVFWFTFNPGLNDQLSHLLFALGHFLWRQGVAGLWGQLVADGGHIQSTLAPGLVRHDLESLRTTQTAPPVLCLDEVDLLRPDEVEAHTRLVAFLENLRGQCPMLIIGQRPVLEVDEAHVLTGLEDEALKEKLRTANLALADEECARILAHTQGNPRLLELLITLLHAGESVAEVLTRLESVGAPSVEFLLNRVWTHLSDDERRILMELAVFRHAAPEDVWDLIHLQQLVKRRLVERDAQGGVILLPAFRAVLHGVLSADEKQAGHIHAAQIRAARAEYTQAAHHYCHANQSRYALHLWQSHSVEEINQGQGQAALALFQQIRTSELDEVSRDILALLLGELRKLNGDDPRADLRQTVWHSATLAAQAKRLEGDLAELKGQFDEAIASYQAGLTLIENLLTEKALFEKDMGWAAMRQGDLSLAWQKACLARFEAERLQGDIQRQMDNLAEAEKHYAQALALAESFKYTDGQAKTHNHLALLLNQRGQFEEAIQHRAQAIKLFQQIGNQIHLTGAKLNQAYDQNMLAQRQAICPPAHEALHSSFEAALQSAQAALISFEHFNQPRGQAIAAQNLAEAQLYLGRFAEAEISARRAMQVEDQSVLADALRTLGEARLGQGDRVEAEASIHQSIQLAQVIEDRYLEAYGWRAMGHVYLTFNQRPEARVVLDRAVRIFESLGLPQEIERTEALWQKYL